MVKQDTIEEDIEKRSLSSKLNREANEKQYNMNQKILSLLTENERFQEKLNESLPSERSQSNKMGKSEAEGREKSQSSIQRDLLLTMLDIKVDLRIEIQKIYHRITRNEELLQEILLKLTQESNVKDNPTSEPLTLEEFKPLLAQATTGSELTENLGGNGLGPILLRKRRSKSKKAPAPPKQSYDQKPLLEKDSLSTDDLERKN